MILAGLVFIVPTALAEEVSRFVRPEQATTYVDPVTKTEVTILIDRHLGGTTELTLGYLVVPPGVDVPNHIHQSTETFYILSGEMEQTSEGKVQTLSAGMACLVPANTTTRHTVKVQGPGARVGDLDAWRRRGTDYKGVASKSCAIGISPRHDLRTVTGALH